MIPQRSNLTTSGHGKVINIRRCNCEQNRLPRVNLEQERLPEILGLTAPFCRYPSRQVTSPVG
jgi:hypothetical protein